jgi:glycosyltransferase involved in cell wall biosynthesis
MVSLQSELARMGHPCELFFFERGSGARDLPANVRIHFGTLADLMRLVAAQRVDVVHANNIDWPTGISVVRRLGATLVLTAHKVRDPAWTHGWTARNCDAFVGVSQWIRDGLQPFTDARIQVVHNGIDTRRFTDGDSPRVAEGDSAAPIVAWIGRGAAPRKRLEAFAAIAPALQRAGLRIWVIDQQGPDQFAARCPEHARELLAVAERWQGVSFDDMPAFYGQVAASGGCVVSTASMEGLPLTLLEAQACGCPVIGADVQGVNECVSPDHGGMLYPLAIDPGALAALVVEAVADRRALESRGRRASAFVHERFSLAGMVERYLDVYRAAPLGAVAGPDGSRYRLSPLLHWHAYLDERLGVGYAQYAASQQLARTGDPAGAAAAAREALVTAPTMYARPERLAHLLRVSMQSGARWARESVGETGA